MKAVISTIFIYVVTLASIIAGPVSIQVKASSKASVFYIDYRSEMKENVSVSILNSQNIEIFSEKFNKVTSFTRPYNFSDLQEGEYTIAVKDQNGSHSEKINYSLNKLESSALVSEVHETKYWLNVFNNGSEIINVRIISQSGDKLFEQSVEVKGSFSQVYDLSKVKSYGALTFEVVHGKNQVYTETF